MGLVPVTAGEIRLDGKSVRRLSTAAIVREGLVQVPERRQLFGSMTVEENLRMGAFAVKDRGSISGRDGAAVRAVPDPARAAAPARLDAERRRAADGGDRARHDGGAAAHAARRALARAGAAVRDAHLRADQGLARRAAGPSCWSSRTRGSRCRSPIAATCWKAGGSAWRAAPPSCCTIRMCRTPIWAAPARSSRAMEDRIRAMRRAMQAERAAAIPS